MSSKTTDREVPGEELFRQMDEVIRTQRLYADPYIQRHDILVRFGLSRRTLCALMSAYAGGQSITAYINSLRMEDVERLVREHPEMSFTDIADSVGLTLATFRDQFKHRFGMTPTEYRQKNQ